MNKKLLIIIAAVVLLGAGAAAYFLFIAPAANTDEVVTSTYVPGDYFVTNMADMPNLVKFSVALQVNCADTDTEMHDFLTANTHVVRAMIVRVVRSKTYAELTSQDINAVLEGDMIRLINENLGMDIVNTIYFSDYVVQ